MASVEPNALLQNAMLLLTFVVYFIGIVIRKKTMPGSNSLDLTRQLVLGVPIALLVVPPFVGVLLRTADVPGFLLTLGIIMEQGMVMNESATYQLSRLARASGADRNLSQA